MSVGVRIVARAALAGVVLALVCMTAPSFAAELQPVDLRVGGGEQTWHADNDFRLDWDRPPGAGEHPITAANLRIRDAGGTVVMPLLHIPGDPIAIDHVHVPPLPGVYTAEVWLESEQGPVGPPAAVALRFDDSRPQPVRPLAPSGWIAGTTPAVVTIERPDGPHPPSGIRGYAVAVGGGNAPCASLTRCSLAETDLRGGAEDDTISLGILPEGINVIRAVAVSGAGVSSPESGSAIVRVDATRPTVNLTGAPRGWAGGPVRLTATAADSLSGMAANGRGGPHTGIAIDDGVPRVDPGSSATTIVSGEGSHSVAAFARDAVGNLGQADRVTTVSIDETPPLVTFARAQSPDEPERLEATVSDPLAGASAARGAIAVRPAGSRQRWRPLPTTVAAGRLTALWDSDSFAPGRYEFRATGYDAAGNMANSERRANRTRMILVNPLKAPVRIAAGLGARLAATSSIAYGHGAVYSGRLALRSGAAVGSQPVRVIETFDAGSDPARRVTVVQTGVHGDFSVRLSPGPSRRIEVRFEGSRLLSRASGGEAHLDVAAGVRFRASADSARVGGAPIVFSGRIGGRGADRPVEGIPVELQFRLSQGRWSEFRTVQTDANGHFRYAYAFSDDDSRGVRFRFRAYIGGGGWPYEPAASRTVRVTGR